MRFQASEDPFAWKIYKVQRRGYGYLLAQNCIAHPGTCSPVKHGSSPAPLKPWVGGLYTFINAYKKNQNNNQWRIL